MVFRKLLLMVMAGTGTLMTCGAGFATDAVSLNFQGESRSYTIEASFNVKAERSVVWDVLTGYEQLPRYVSSLKKSHVVQDLGPYHFILEQEFEGGFLFFTKRIKVLLEVHEKWYRTIRFEDKDHKDFEFYQGSWTLEPDADQGLKIIYRLKAKQNFDAPFAGDYTKGGIKDLLEALRREILRRQAEEVKDESRPIPLTPSIAADPVSPPSSR